MECKITYNYLDPTSTIIKREGDYSVSDYFGKNIEDIIMYKREGNSNISFDKQKCLLRISCPTEECKHIIQFKVIKIDENKKITFVCPYCNVKLFNINAHFAIVPSPACEDKTSQIDIGGTIIACLTNFLTSLGDKNDVCTITRDKDIIEFRAAEPGNINQYLVLRLVFLYDSRQVQIPNILVTDKLRHTGTGKKMIKIIYELCKFYEYDLFIVDMVESFYNRMLKRGALRIDADTVQITDKTELF